MRCFKCGCSPQDEALFRQNEKGVKGIWACAWHRAAPVDSQVQELVDVIQPHSEKEPNAKS